MEQMTFEMILTMIDHTVGYFGFILLAWIFAISLWIAVKERIFCVAGGLLGFMLGLSAYFIYLQSRASDLGGMLDLVIPVQVGLGFALVIGAYAGWAKKLYNKKENK